MNGFVLRSGRWVLTQFPEHSHKYDSVGQADPEDYVNLTVDDLKDASLESLVKIFVNGVFKVINKS